MLKYFISNMNISDINPVNAALIYVMTTETVVKVKWPSDIALKEQH